MNLNGWCLEYLILWISKYWSKVHFSTLVRHLCAKYRVSAVRKLDKYNAFIEPLSKQLSEEMGLFPVTIAYVENLEALGYCYKYLAYVLKDRQFNGKESIPENRLFAQYHTDYTNDMKKMISSDLAKKTPTIRLVLATVALSIWLNAPSVVRVLHMRPSVCLESYMQEIGRAGRSGQSASAVMFLKIVIFHQIGKEWQRIWSDFAKTLILVYGYSWCSTLGSVKLCSLVPKMNAAKIVENRTWISEFVCFFQEKESLRCRSALSKICSC